MNTNIKEKIELVKRLRGEFIDYSPQKIIKRSYEEFSDKLAVTTAFGYSGMILLNLIKNIAPEIEIYFIDTRFHFEETLKLRDKIIDEWKLNIITIYPSFPEKELEKIMGKEAYKINPDLCCHYRKVEPLLRVLQAKKGWLSSIRRDQSRTRAKIESVEIDQRGTIKINPFWNWSRDDAWLYIRKYDIPYNPLHDQYFPSVGCKPCTAPVDKGGDERDGRWQGFMKMECGIHTFNNDKEKKESF